MDWVAIGRMIAPLAPTLGGIVGDMLPIPAGSLIGRQAGEMLATALGVPNDPNEIATAITNDPDAPNKIARAEAEASAKWQGLAEMAKAMYESNTAQAAEINTTIRAELVAGQKWWAWRNLYGYSVGLEATATSWVVIYSLIFDQSVFKNVSESLSFFISWYTLRFGLLGYIHNQSTQEKVAAVTGQKPESVVKSVVKAIKGK